MRRVNKEERMGEKPIRRWKKPFLAEFEGK
jgi:hypothetical protein